MKFEEIEVLTVPIVNPARRHKCEQCQEIFECHLCDIGNTHILHNDSITMGQVYICLKCVEHCGWVSRITMPKIRGDKKNGNYIKRYNYRTGELLEKKRLRHGKEKIKVWLKDGVTIEDINNKFKSNWKSIKWSKN